MPFTHTTLLIAILGGGSNFDGETLLFFGFLRHPTFLRRKEGKRGRFLLTLRHFTTFACNLVLRLAGIIQDCNCNDQTKFGNRIVSSLCLVGKVWSGFRVWRPKRRAMKTKDKCFTLTFLPRMRLFELVGLVGEVFSLEFLVVFVLSRSQDLTWCSGYRSGGDGKPGVGRLLFSYDLVLFGLDCAVQYEMLCCSKGHLLFL
ncbi:hypothetical protein VTK26DRAFT_4713 [Humicola hyalothermophila]